MKVSKIPEKASMMGLISVKEQGYSVKTATLLLAGLTKDSLRNMIPKLAVLKRIIREKGLRSIKV